MPENQELDSVQFSKSQSTTWQTVGAVQEFSVDERGLILICEHGRVEVRLIAEDCLRVRFKARDGAFENPPFSYAVHKTDWQPVTFEINDGVESIELRSPALLCYINK